MAILLHDHRIAYFPVPKCACSSMKLMFYQVNTGETWVRAEQPYATIHAHPDYQTKSFAESCENVPEGYAKIALVRPPMRRFLSAYDNKIVKEHDTTAADLDVSVAYPESLEDFVTRIDAISAGSPLIRQHIRPIVDFLGHDPAYFDAIFTLTHMKPLNTFLTDRLGTGASLRHANKTKQASTADVLSPEALATVRKRYLPDRKFIKSAQALGVFHGKSTG